MDYFLSKHFWLEKKKEAFLVWNVLDHITAIYPHMQDQLCIPRTLSSFSIYRREMASISSYDKNYDWRFHQVMVTEKMGL